MLDASCWLGEQQTTEPLKFFNFKGVKYFEVRVAGVVLKERKKYVVCLWLPVLGI
jgi:hypothetical protein